MPENGKKEIQIYKEIERLVRKNIKIPRNANEYLKKRLENDIYYRVKGCEIQDKYVHTLKLYYKKKKVKTILDVGGGQGGLIKCFSKYYPESLLISLDRTAIWTEVVRLRSPNIQIVIGDARNLPFKKESVDLIVSQALLEHIKEHDLAINEMCNACKEACFISWNPNKFFLYDFGHLDAPTTIMPKSISKYIAILWHKIRGTGKSESSIISELEGINYISTNHVKNLMKKHGCVYNVFTDFSLFSIESKYFYRAEKIRRFFKKNKFLMKIICNLLILLRIEPQCYYILKKGGN